MNYLIFQDSSNEVLLADLEAMADYIGMLKTADVDAMRPQLDATLSRARQLLQGSARAARRARTVPWRGISAAIAAASAFLAVVAVVRYRASL